MVSVNTHGLLGELRKPIDLKKVKMLLNQCMGDLTNPYNVLFNFQYVFLVEKGQPLGGFMITISSAGRMPLQNAFLTSPCRSLRCLEIARDSKHRNWFCDMTGAYFSNLE